MNDKERENLVEKESLKMLLEEFASEQQTSNKALDDLVKTMNQLTNRISKMEEKQSKPMVQVSVDTTPVQKIVQEGIAGMKLLAATKPRPLLRKFQVLLFPEQDARLFYKIVFGRWFLMLVILFALSCLYKLGVHWSNNRQEIKLEQLENDRIRKSWHYLYYQNGKNIKQLMDKAYMQSGKEDKENKGSN